jgi:phospholipid/cholesterol/gamma-HCH transport system substrate-binding protein
MLSKVTRIKLFVFVGITAVALCLTALNYVKLPQQVGIGRYAVDVELTNAGGLYPQAVVTYRGVEVGKVVDVELKPGGEVVARLQVDNDTRIPRDSVAQVRSASVIGEQYVNFVPSADYRKGEFLEDGATVPAERTTLPTSTDTLLSSVDGLLGSIPLDDLRSVVHELGVASDGVGDDLGTLIADSHSFQEAATADLPATIRLIEDARPVLATQQDLDPQIRSFARSLGSFTGQLEAADGQLRGVLAAGAPFMDQVGAFADQLDPVLPGMLAELADTGEVLNVYKDGIEHVLTVAPALFPMLTGSIPVDRRDDARSPANLWFKLSVDPPSCTPGFENADKMRDPSVLSPAAPPQNSWCKVPANDPRAARGARNHPCPNGGTGATAALCGLVFDKSTVPPGRIPAGDQTVPQASPAGLLDQVTSLLLLGGAPTPDTLTELLTGLVAP